MKVAFDTSVIVPALLPSHPQHDNARRWVEAVRGGRCEGIVATHGLAESWAKLTSLPQMKVAPATALAMLDSLRHTLCCEAADVPLYDAALARTVAKGLSSGAIYDALHLEVARARGATHVLTFNTRHFLALQRNGDPNISAPTDAPPP